MVLISIQPFAVKKIFLYVLALVCLSSAACFAQSSLLLVAATPYDHQMTRIQPVLTSKIASSKNVSLDVVNRWMADLRAIPYGFTPQWKTPAEVQVGPVADCKGKAVALYQKMQAAGAQGVKLVIGKRTSLSRKTHAWLEWNTGAGNYVLDPTINWNAYRAEQVGNGNYVPLYAYSGARKYRAAASGLYAQN
ncbi:MAG: hypothetical protein QOG48_869 [Verrucomicrobiota bacterium]|jgi:predicted transglutaminase-like cysteine proteinase